MVIGINIKKYRKELGLTQTELAEKIGAMQQHVYRWEHNIIIPSLETIKKLAQVLQVSTDNLLLTDRERKKLKSGEKELLEKMKDIEKLSPEDRTTIINLIDVLKLKANK